MRFRVLFTLLVASAVLATSTRAQANVRFPDVSDGHLNAEGIYALVGAGVVHGHPSGEFKPGDPVDRAAMLKMLFLATGKQPESLDRGCFDDVERHSWYEGFVCAAARLRYVIGYATGLFKPGQPVNKVEAIKMTMEVFELPVDDMDDVDLKVVNFVDVSLSAWYTKYLVSAFKLGILPLPGQDGGRLEPDTYMTRASAASLIHNAMKADLLLDRQPPEEEEEEEEEREEEEVTGDMMDVVFPFEHSGKFVMKKPFSYRFVVDGDEQAWIDASLQSGQPGTLICRLYKMEETGFSDEYYLGVQEGSRCLIRATLGSGTYQLQLQPSEKDVTYTVSALRGQGDGNDGFSEAVSLPLDQLIPGTLAAGDLTDWYSFSISAEQSLMVEAQNAVEVTCLVYASADVDLASFEGPQCNQSFSYTPGTYYIAVGRTAPVGASQTYSVYLKDVGSQ